MIHQGDPLNMGDFDDEKTAAMVVNYHCNRLEIPMLNPGLPAKKLPLPQVKALFKECPKSPRMFFILL